MGGGGLAEAGTASKNWLFLRENWLFLRACVPPLRWPRGVAAAGGDEANADSDADAQLEALPEQEQRDEAGTSSVWEQARAKSFWLRPTRCMTDVMEQADCMFPLRSRGLLVHGAEGRHARAHARACRISSSLPGPDVPLAPAHLCLAARRWSSFGGQKAGFEVEKLEKYEGRGGPVQSTIRVPLFAAPTLDAVG